MKGATCTGLVHRFACSSFSTVSVKGAIDVPTAECANRFWLSIEAAFVQDLSPGGDSHIKRAGMLVVPLRG